LIRESQVLSRLASTEGQAKLASKLSGLKEEITASAIVDESSVCESLDKGGDSESNAFVQKWQKSQKDLTELQIKLDSTKATNENLKEMIARYNNSETKKESEGLPDYSATLFAKKKALFAEHAEMKNEVISLRQQSTTLSESKSKSLSRCSEIESEIKELESKAGSLKSHFSSLRDGVTSSRNEFVKNQREINELRQQFSATKASAEEVRSEILSMSGEKKAIDMENKESQIKLEEIQLLCEEIKSKIQSISQINETMELKKKTWKPPPKTPEKISFQQKEDIMGKIGTLRKTLAGTKIMQDALDDHFRSVTPRGNTNSSKNEHSNVMLKHYQEIYKEAEAQGNGKVTAPILIHFMENLGKSVGRKDLDSALMLMMVSSDDVVIDAEGNCEFDDEKPITFMV